MEIVRKIQCEALKEGSLTAGQTAAPAVVPKNAFTLIELLVYMAIMGFIIVVAGRAFSDSTGMRIRSQNMLQSAEEAGRVSALLKEDISQMGAKSWGRSNNNDIVFEVANDVFLQFNPAAPNATGTDLSSFTLDRTGAYDDFTFRKVHYDADGVCGAVLEIRWHVENGTLMRKCAQQSKPNGCNGAFTEADCPASVEMARNVAVFKLLPSMPGSGPASINAADILFPLASANTFRLIKKDVASSAFALPTGGGARVTLRNFTRNAPNNIIHTNFLLAAENQSSCSQLEFLKNEEYVITFELPCNTPACRNVADAQEKYNPMIMFQPSTDHLSVGLRNTSSGAPITTIPDFLFYPPQDDNSGSNSTRVRHFEFSVPQDITTCVGITAAFYSPAADGRLEIQNFKVYRKTDNVYHFDRSANASTYNPSLASDKAKVKAFELTLGINKNSEINNVLSVIPVPNNGVGGI